MSMCLYWSYECYFVLEQLESKTLGMFILGCLISALFSLLSMASKKIKQLIIDRFAPAPSFNQPQPVFATDRLNRSGDIIPENKPS